MHKEATRPQYWILDFKKDLPDILGKTVISPLHYGETVEISFVRGIEGETFINGKRFDYHEKNVFFIPPKYLHTSTYRHGGIGKNDMVCAFHINVDALAPFIDVNSLFFRFSLLSNELTNEVQVSVFFQDEPPSEPGK